MSSSENLKELKEQIRLYLESKLELYRLDAIDHSSYLFSVVIGMIIMVTILLIFLISLGFFLGHWLGELLSSVWLGFGLVSLFYLLILLLFSWRFKSWVRIPLQNILIKKIDQYYEEKGK